MNDLTNIEGIFEGAESFNYSVSFSSFTPNNKECLQEAIKVWCSNRELAIKKYGTINEWDTSSITDMSYLFSNYGKFNDPIGDWDVSNVTNMKNMFNNAESFNQPLDSWDVSSVKNMKGMFQNAGSFNQSLHSWNVISIVKMKRMFNGTDSLIIKPSWYCE